MLGSDTAMVRPPMISSTLVISVLVWTAAATFVCVAVIAPASSVASNPVDQAPSGDCVPDCEKAAAAACRSAVKPAGTSEGIDEYCLKLASRSEERRVGK